MSDQTIKLLIGAAILLGLLYWLNKQDSNKPVKNNGSLPPINVSASSQSKSKSLTQNKSQDPTDVYMGRELLDPRPKNAKVLPNVDNSDLSMEVNYGETSCKTELCENTPSSSKVTGKTEIDEWDEYFKDGNMVIEGSQISREDDRYVPRDETGGSLAPYECNSTYKRTKEKKRYEPDGSFDPDMYDPMNLLPKEVHDDWFEVIDEPVALKNRHLINLQQPLGINTVGQSLKNATHDLRGNPVCPKFVVSPFLNSTIEPDFNIKPLY